MVVEIPAVASAAAAAMAATLAALRAIDPRGLRVPAAMVRRDNLLFDWDGGLANVAEPWGDRNTVHEKLSIRMFFEDHVQEPDKFICLF